MTIQALPRDLKQATPATTEQMAAIQIPCFEYFAPQPAATETAPRETVLDQMFGYFAKAV